MFNRIKIPRSRRSRWANFTAIWLAVAAPMMAWDMRLAYTYRYLTVTHVAETVIWACLPPLIWFAVLAVFRRADPRVWTLVLLILSAGMTALFGYVLGGAWQLGQLLQGYLNLSGPAASTLAFALLASFFGAAVGYSGWGWAPDRRDQFR